MPSLKLDTPGLTAVARGTAVRAGIPTPGHDPRNGQVPNANLCEYTVPLHADARRAMDVIFVEENDPHVNPLGVKGIGEIATVGVPLAIVNAIYHATGKRVQELPVTPDKLM